ncbi:hypothetical protein QJS83_17175 [Bdellovibrio sp. 22V]|uniref:hypothetical protein n=1 Tax=Bdellovibrio sp. 22V TaxID=3044166 RepID=UPI002542F37E|nr:hypothetical protein [Bdellovibrio sp. 22V]WII72197.1 hypothetical protein QJS83_17175 [Bdellovibrio sp. 22V]
MKKIILSGLLITTLFCNTGCDSSDIAAGAIGIAIGIGIGSSDHGHHHGHDRRPPRYRQCGRHRCYEANTQIDVGTSPQVVEFAQRHQISLAAAEQIDAAFAAVPNEGLKAFAQVGLSERDLKDISKRSLPEPASIAKVATKLDMSQAQARDLLKEIIADFDVQASDVQSPYWKACMAKGKWKTPSNRYCKKTFWPGCSPETGATRCI